MAMQVIMAFIAAFSNVAKTNPAKHFLRPKNISIVQAASASYQGTVPNHAAKILKDSHGKRGFGSTEKAHPLYHVSYKGRPDVRLDVVSRILQTKFLVHKNNAEVKIFGKTFVKTIELLELKLNNDDDSTMYFGTKKNKEYYPFNNPCNNQFFEFICKETGTITPKELKNKFNQEILHYNAGKHCIEAYSSKLNKTGFKTLADMALATHFALRTPEGQNAIQHLNSHFASKEFVKRNSKTLPVNAPRKIIGTYYVKGKCVDTFIIKNIILVLDHSNGHQNNPNGPLHVHTCFPVYENFKHK